MNKELILIVSNLTSFSCVIAAGILAFNRIDGWGWFLFIALLALSYPEL